MGSTSALPESREIFPLRAVLDAMGEGVTIVDADGRMYFSNQAADRILGQGITDGPPEAWAEHYGVFLPDGETRFPAREYPLVLALEGVHTDDVEMVIRNPLLSGPRRIIVTGRPVRDEAGRIVGAAVVFRDVTSVREAEDQLREAHARMEAVVRARDELARFLVHDLKSPMTSILGLCDLLLEDVPKGSDRREMLQQIRHSTDTLHRMTLNLLDIQMAEAGKLVPTVEAVELGSVLDEVTGVLSGRARLSAMHVELLGSSPPPTVRGDRELLRRLFVNLVDNSIKYGPNGGRIEIDWMASADGRVLVRVMDQGPGVPEDLREAVFEEYAAVERDRAAREGGSHGLGLRFCKLAAEAQDARIWITDNRPVGACFNVELPSA